MIQESAANQVGTRFNKFMLLLMTVALSVMSMVANARGSEVSISLWDNDSFEIEFDHKRYYSDCDFELTGLAPGKHRVRVMQRTSNPYGGGTKVSVLYNGFIDVPRHKKVIAKIKPNRRLRVIQTIDLRPQGCHTYGCTGCNDCSSGCDYGCSGDCSHGNGNDWGNGRHDRPWGQGTIDTGSCGTGGYGISKPTNGYDRPVIECLDRQDVYRLLDDLDRQCFDDDKLAMAKRRLRHKHIEARHLRLVLETLSFECNRLELAKFASDKVSDPHNLYLIYDAFDFNSSINELDEYIYG